MLEHKEQFSLTIKSVLQNFKSLNRKLFIYTWIKIQFKLNLNLAQMPASQSALRERAQILLTTKVTSLALLPDTQGRPKLSLLGH